MLNDGPSGLVSGGAGITEPFFTSYEEIGGGATHILWRARRYGRWYVLKGLRKELRGNPFYEEWLYKEYSIGISLDHPSIVRIESLEDDAVVGRCIVMEWVEGMTGRRLPGPPSGVLPEQYDESRHQRIVYFSTKKRIISK